MTCGGSVWLPSDDRLAGSKLWSWLLVGVRSGSSFFAAADAGTLMAVPFGDLGLAFTPIFLYM